MAGRSFSWSCETLGGAPCPQTQLPRGGVSHELAAQVRLACRKASSQVPNGLWEVGDVSWEAVLRRRQDSPPTQTPPPVWLPWAGVMP